MAATFPGTPSLSRRKSTTRYILRLPPPRNRAVVNPWLFRPPLRQIRFVRFFSGGFFVRSEKSRTCEPRRPALVGL